MNILDFIPTGKENAVSKQKLCELTGTDERLIRASIKRQVENGVPILSSSGHKGYWYSDDIDEIEEFIRENEHRVKSLTRTTAKLKKHLYEMKNIRVTSVRQHYRKLQCDYIEGQLNFEKI